MAAPVLSAFGSALSNARQAAADIALAVFERAQLTTTLDAVAPVETGHLVRLTPATCFTLLATRSVGRLAYVARAGVPDLVPVNYRLAGHTVYIASGPGPKLQAADRHDLVAFQVDAIDEDSHTGWSVVAHGKARRLSPDQRRALLSTDDAPEPWALGPRNDVVAIDLARITGRQLH
jgi:nitroimidazol reductase NimA-like FMN-containing flavoprotein (pyridoxamine 5'-phosphate oxidase superfamily)